MNQGGNLPPDAWASRGRAPRSGRGIWRLPRVRLPHRQEQPSRLGLFHPAHRQSEASRQVLEHRIRIELRPEPDASTPSAEPLTARFPHAFHEPPSFPVGLRSVRPTRARTSHLGSLWEASGLGCLARRERWFASRRECCDAARRQQKSNAAPIKAACVVRRTMAAEVERYPNRQRLSHAARRRRSSGEIREKGRKGNSRRK